MGYSLCMMAAFQNALTSRIFGVLSSFFCTQLVQIICRMDFGKFFGILISHPYEDFAWAIAYA